MVPGAFKSEIFQILKIALQWRGNAYSERTGALIPSEAGHHSERSGGTIPSEAGRRSERSGALIRAKWSTIGTGKKNRRTTIYPRFRFAER